MNKTITLIGVNFFPEETAIGLYSTQMAEYLSKQGFKINVVTGFPYYPQWDIYKNYKSKSRFAKEQHGDINVFRYKQYVPEKPSFLKRVFHILDFTIGSYFNIKKIKETNIIIVIVPFTTAILLGKILKKKTKAKLWIHVQDFEFDAALQTGVTKKKEGVLKNFVFNMLYKFEKWLFSNADVASSISHSMQEKLKSKIGEQTKIHYLPNWIDVSDSISLTVEKHNFFNTKKFNILYSGSIADKQDWEFFIQFVDRLDPKQVQVVVVGDGSKKDWLINRLDKYSNVECHPPVPYNDLSLLLTSADLHCLFQKEDVVDSVMPSKLLGMMGSGRPSLITGNPKSEVKKVMDESKGGFYESKVNIETIIVKVESLIIDSDKSSLMGANAKNYVIENFDSKTILKNLEDKLNAL